MKRWTRIKRIRKKRETGSENPATLTEDLSSNLDRIHQSIGRNPDVIVRRFHVGNSDLEAAVVFIDGLVDKERIDRNIMKPLMLEISKEKETVDMPGCLERLRDYVEQHVITAGGINKTGTLEDCVWNVLSGNTALLVDGSREVLILGTAGWQTRSVEEPEAEPVVRGPRDGFTETLRHNTAMIRRRIKDPDLTMVPYQVGRRSKTDLWVVYIQGVANPEIVNEVKRRVERIDLDDVLESGYIEQAIEDHPFSPFPQVQSTERPDRVVSALTEGRVALLLDGTPFALIVPVTLPILLQAPEDYYERWVIGSLIRLMRYGAAFIALFLPAIYIALVSYNQGLLPTELAISIAATREGVPFPTFMEALMMEVMVEVLREAGIRLPKPIGQAIGIVGGLVIGEAAVQAGIVSPTMVIVVAATAISSFAMPQYGIGIAFRTVRFLGMACAALLGTYGVVMFFIFVSIHLVKLKSFGVSYLSPAIPYQPKDWKDLLIRLPMTKLRRHPKIVTTKDT